MSYKMPIPTEAQEQKALFEWAEWARHRYPELALMFHVPNEAKRSYALGNEMKAQGMKAGVPDLFLPVARGEYHGLFIELKRVRNYKLSDVQRKWLGDLTRQGYKAVMCRGWGEASRMIVDYLNIGR